MSGNGCTVLRQGYSPRHLCLAVVLGLLASVSSKPAVSLCAYSLSCRWVLQTNRDERERRAEFLPSGSQHSSKVAWQTRQRRGGLEAGQRLTRAGGKGRIPDLGPVYVACFHLLQSSNVLPVPKTSCLPVCLCVHVCAHACEGACGGQQLTWSIFLNCSTLIFFLERRFLTDLGAHYFS